MRHFANDTRTSISVENHPSASQPPANRSPRQSRQPDVKSGTLRVSVDRDRGIVFFRILWVTDVVVGIVAVIFFVIGIGDGSVSSFNIAVWLLLLAGLATIVFGSRALQRVGHRALATGLAAVPAIPAILGGGGLVAATLMGVRWN